MNRFVAFLYARTGQEPDIARRIQAHKGVKALHILASPIDIVIELEAQSETQFLKSTKKMISDCQSLGFKPRLEGALIYGPQKAYGFSNNFTLNSFVFIWTKKGEDLMTADIAKTIDHVREAVMLIPLGTSSFMRSPGFSFIAKIETNNTEDLYNAVESLPKRFPVRDTSTGIVLKSFTGSE